MADLRICHVALIPTSFLPDIASDSPVSNSPVGFSLSFQDRARDLDTIQWHPESLLIVE
jgi:hypothetical protein